MPHDVRLGRGDEPLTARLCAGVMPGDTELGLAACGNRALDSDLLAAFVQRADRSEDPEALAHAREPHFLEGRLVELQECSALDIVFGEDGSMLP